MGVTQILKSRTVWTAVLGALLNASPQIADAVSAAAGPGAMAVVNAAVALATIYFRANAKQGVTPSK